MTLTGMKKHSGVLEQAGLVTTKKIGARADVRLGPRRLEDETMWLERIASAGTNASTSWTRFVEELTRKEKAMKRKIEVARPVRNRTTVERKSDREVVVTRTINGPARIVFEAFTKPSCSALVVPSRMGMTLLVLRGGPRRRQVPIGIRPRRPRACRVFRQYVEVSRIRASRGQ